MANPLRFQFESENHRNTIVIDDGKFFYFRVVIESSSDANSIPIHRYLNMFWGIIFDHNIYPDKDKDHDTHHVESDEKSPDNEGEGKNPSSHIPSGSFILFGGNIPGKHRFYRLAIIVLTINHAETAMTKPMIPCFIVSAHFFLSSEVRPIRLIWKAPYIIITTAIVAANPRMVVVAKLIIFGISSKLISPPRILSVVIPVVLSPNNPVSPSAAKTLFDTIEVRIERKLKKKFFINNFVKANKLC